MSDNEDTNSRNGFDTIDHQPAYIYTPSSIDNDASERPAKRRKVAKPKSTPQIQEELRPLIFEPLLQDLEGSEYTGLRQELFRRFWSETDARIQSVLDEANEGTLAEVTRFVNDRKDERETGKIPASFIVTGPNIASQGPLFKQLSTRLKTEINGPVVVLRSGDASNLKAILKQLIRDATSQHLEEDEFSYEQDGRKLLNYDLEIIHCFVKKYGTSRVVIAFQDIEAFETSLVVELITLFSSWMDHIPFVLLFGIATSVELFEERLPRIASRCLHGIQVNVEQTSSVLERIFQRAVANSEAPLQMTPAFMSSLIERQHDHVQSAQSFVAALKYAYMCHFFGNALSILNDPSSIKLLQPYHYEAIRMLPSFRSLIERAVQAGEVTKTRELLEDDGILAQEIERTLKMKERTILHLLRSLHVLSSVTLEPIGKIDIYNTVFDGALGESNYLRRFADSVKRMTPDELIIFTKKITHAIANGSSEMDLDGWAHEDQNFLGLLKKIEMEVAALEEQSIETGKPIRSSYAIHNKALRTTVIAQRVQLSYEESTITEHEKEFTDHIDRLCAALEQYFTLDDPQNLFLNEIWLCDSTASVVEAFAPRPRATIEKALSAPQEYLDCAEDQSSSLPATAILYQRYLEAGSLISIADLWSAFLEIFAREEDEADERQILLQFYRALADLKLLGMIKQSKKKADHLAKITWKGL